MVNATQAVGGVVYGLLRTVLGSAVRLYYRRIEVRHAERIPADRPLLIVANHPASLTDVLVLGAALRRRLHFVAHSGLFQPWLRGVILRLAGTVPVYRREDDPALVHRNDEMFSACHRLLDAGGVVLIFPEGTSQSDRKVEKLKTGAARLALANEFRPDHAGGLTLLPIGLHFAERIAFKSNVVLSVGRPIELEPFRAAAAADEAQAVRDLTDRIQFALEKLILHVPSAELHQLLRDIERMYLEDLRAASPDAPDLALIRGVADSIEYFRRTDPPRLYQMWREVTSYQRKLGALDLRDQSLRDSLAGTRSRAPAHLAALAVAGMPLALLGSILNAVPYRLTAIVGGWFANDPTRIAFGRIVTALLLFPLVYAGVAFALVEFTPLDARKVAALLALSVPLGLFALAYFRWLRRERHRLRMAWLTSLNRRMVARLRAERRRLVRMLDTARADYIASGEPRVPGNKP